MNTREVSPWSIEELCTTLKKGVPLPGDSSFLVEFQDDELDFRRRELAIQCLMRYYSEDHPALQALRHYALNGYFPKSRCLCLTELQKREQIDGLIPTLVEDTEPILRVYALEYLLINYPWDYSRIQSLYETDQEIRVHETLYCFQLGKLLPLFEYEPLPNSRYSELWKWSKLGVKRLY